MQFDTKTKLSELKREAAMRRKVYAHRVVEGRMLKADADKKIAILDAIIADYEAIKAQEQPGLF